METGDCSRQNAGVIPRILVALVLPLALTACGEDAASHVVQEVKLDVGKAPSAQAPAGGAAQTPAQQPVPQPAAGERTSAPTPSNAGAKRAPEEEGALDGWHRSLAAARAAGDPAAKGAAGALAALGQALTGGAAAFQTQLAQKAPTALGSEYQRLAQAYASGGTAALEAALVTAAGASALAWNEVLAVRALELGETQRAGRALARLTYGMANAAYPRERILELAPMARRVAEGIGGVLQASDYVVAKNDSYWKICSGLRKQGKPIEHGWIKLFNRRKGDNLAVGDKLRIPGTFLRVEGWRQLRFVMVMAGDLPIRIYASSSGKPESPTPLGEFTLKVCEKNPVYYPPSAPAVPYGNPDNPLGERWMGFAEDKQYGLHGTNNEATIGSFETGGCIRMHNVDAVELFDLVGPGAKVKIHP